MLYLTKMFLNASICRRENLRDAYSLHKLVYTCFPKQDVEQNFLYADKGFQEGGRFVLMLSSRMPQIPSDISAATTEISDRFFSFSEYRFEILLNPVRKNSADGKRRPILGQLNLLQWFLAHRDKWGFEADSETLEARILPTVQFTKKDCHCIFHAVKFRGRLKVTDPSLFRHTVADGIGHGKAFGFGLLQLVPIQM